MTNVKFKTGDFVGVLKYEEIQKTLDANGTLDGLPFMPEMIQYCGKRFRVKLNVEKTCVSCLFTSHRVQNSIRQFILNDIIFLENLRCDGNFHDSCQEGCMIFWKSSWLNFSTSALDQADQKTLIETPEPLKVKTNDRKYFCQSTQLHKITRKLSLFQKFTKLTKEIARGDVSLFIALESLLIPVIRKFTYEKNFEMNGSKTPAESLNLEPGECVQVKSFEEIVKTLDSEGRNKGLEFYHDMKQFCGQILTVRNRLDRMINEATGDMMEIKNTVILEDTVCSYQHSFLGCPRERFQIWREIWLKRVSEKVHN